MASIREFHAEDAAPVAALHERVFGPSHAFSSCALADYYEEIFCDSPWSDASLPSLVATANGHGIAGFVGVVPRPMRFRGRDIRAAVCAQFMADPLQGDGLTALRLLKAFLSGVQDLSFADGANEPARRVWMGLGGAPTLPYSLHWTRLLRPARHALSLLEGRARVPAVVARAVRPLCAMADAPIARLRPNGFQRQDPDIVEEAPEPAMMLACLPDILKGSALQPAYDASSLAWLLRQSALKTRHGKLRSRLVRDRAAGPLGWYLYYLQPGGASEVLQVAAREGAFDRVLQRLLADAWHGGATAVRGRLDPRFVQELSDRHCWFRREGTWMIAHSRHSEVMHALHRGEAFISRLEGEWWLRFGG